MRRFIDILFFIPVTYPAFPWSCLPLDIILPSLRSDSQYSLDNYFIFILFIATMYVLFSPHKDRRSRVVVFKQHLYIAFLYVWFKHYFPGTFLIHIRVVRSLVYDSMNVWYTFFSIYISALLKLYSFTLNFKVAKSLFKIFSTFFCCCKFDVLAVSLRWTGICDRKHYIFIP